MVAGNMEASGKPSRKTFQARLDNMVDAIRNDIMNG
ncbi:MAG: hypothetical protein K0R28_4998, partial [Paenibacillus sp.]|nr:hypothetical protein [Paenibacillus sp.]